MTQNKSVVYFYGEDGPAEASLFAVWCARVEPLGVKTESHAWKTLLRVVHAHRDQIGDDELRVLAHGPVLNAELVHA